MTNSPPTPPTPAVPSVPSTPSDRVEDPRLGALLAGTRRRLLDDVSDVGAAFPLVLAGGLAARFHGLSRGSGRPGEPHPEPGPGLDFATDTQTPMADVLATVRTGLEARGWRVRDAAADPLAARFTATDSLNDEECEVGIAKETLWRPPARSGAVRVLAVEDVVGTKVRALADRGLARDLVDVHAASDRWSRVELEELGRRHARDPFDLADLKARLEGLDWRGDAEFSACGLDEAGTEAVRRWAQFWADDIGERLAEEAPYEEEPSEEDSSEE
ncbi:nucleotidyl transferase AbiEii/AbiGii toxin family protein [Streptomyces sp. TYQ1024]|nr:nucleotidyl transferase AbiEii/AbiGii toxin family protein [Streptomyces sp. TYQ1024]